MPIKYPSPLNKNMQPRINGLLDSETIKKQKMAEWQDEDCKNLSLLCKHYSIPENAEFSPFYYLALALARDYVPAFHEKKKEGRPQKWGPLPSGYLVVEVERITKDKIKSVEAACRELARREPWQSFVEKWGPQATHSSDPAEALHAQYKKSKNSKWTTVLRRVFIHYEQTQRLTEWDAEMLDVVGKEKITKF